MFCPNCGNNCPDNVNNCPNCGHAFAQAQQPQYQAPQQPYGQAPYGQAPYGQAPFSYDPPIQESTGGLLAWSIIILLLCTIPGIVALIMTTGINSCATRTEQLKKKAATENETAIAQAEREKQVAITKSEAQAQSVLIAAKADADAIKLAADAESYRLQKISEQLTEKAILNTLVANWDGKLPSVVGADMTGILSLDDLVEQEAPVADADNLQ